MAYVIETRTVAEQPTLFVRGKTTVPNIAQAIGEFLSAVGRHLAEHAITPAGMPYTRYHAIDGLDIDLEAGMPVATAAAGGGRVKSGELPGGLVAATVHVGRYEDCESGAALTAWAADNGKRPVQLGDAPQRPDGVAVRTSIGRSSAARAMNSMTRATHTGAHRRRTRAIVGRAKAKRAGGRGARNRHRRERAGRCDK